MAGCCDDRTPHPLETLPAGLAVIPRQIAGFPEVRQRLLERLADPEAASARAALSSWRPYSDDFGSMTLEMWAYVADVLGFYDERIANESYLGTAVRRPALRRLVALLGHTPTAGLAGTAALAALADGSVAVTVPKGTAVRSRGFDGHPPQVFETTAETLVHPLLNAWTVAPFRRRPTVDDSFFVGDTGAAEAGDKSGKAGGGKGGGEDHRVNRVLFLPGGFGLTAGEPGLIESRVAGSDFEPQAALVTATEPFAGSDGKSYTRVSLDPPIVIAPDVDLSTLRARRPTRVAVATVNAPVDDAKGTPPALDNDGSQTRLYLDGPPTGFRAGESVIVARDLEGAEPTFRHVRIAEVKAAAVTVSSIPPTPAPTDANPANVIPSPQVAATELRLEPALPASFLDPATVTFHHGFVAGGSPTNVCRTTVTADEVSAIEGVPIGGAVTLPLDDAEAGSGFGIQATGSDRVLERRFLMTDAEAHGALVDGRLTVATDGTARFQALSRDQITADTLRLPLTIHGNVLDTTRGQSVTGEVLGSGSPRVANQRFKLRKKPLTYLPGTVTGTGDTVSSTLTVRVDGIAWTPVSGFYGCGPKDRVYIVRHDDQQNTFVIFGDGTRGARLPSGVENVVADYRFGAGAAAPPANHIRQLAASLKGLRSVRSPVAATPGKDPDGPESLRTSAPRTALLLGRAVSAADFEALALDAPGVTTATAQWLWIADQGQAGVVVHYIGSTDESTLVESLTAQADPTVPIAVTQAEPITATLTMSVAVDPARVPADVATAVHDALAAGVLDPARAVIGGMVWTSTLFAAAADVDGVISVDSLAITTDEPGVNPGGSGGTCIPSGRYLDFTGTDAITVTGVAATDLPPTPAKGGEP
ncbi:hypothetical protein [Roseospira navarrensis]|uniref:Baseplate protein J-like domain-containing protein n=1 Tax=Roseospira navarrensis TaxID=140058 RepID=A0A7X2D5V8_9PROT|nr:hypothetical protein [Roseospira navarrensis]MQX37645.1 hypothetical protein [Roseospira navarrensis]